MHRDRARTGPTLLKLLEPLSTLEETADWLHLSVETLRSLAERREVPFIKVAGTLRFHREALRSWLRAKERPALVDGPFGPQILGLESVPPELPRSVLLALADAGADS